MAKVLVTGSDGQLGCELKNLSDSSDFAFIFTDVQDLDLSNADAVDKVLSKGEFTFCVNCAAYTAVDKAEGDKDSAFRINTEAVRNLAIACDRYQVTLIHVSTDFVFDGSKSWPLSEGDETNPLSVYGQSKLQGENLALGANKKTYILRTSWLYSAHGNNFVKTMLRLAGERRELGVVADQIGTPTYAYDLAKTIHKILISDVSGQRPYGLYHYSNEGAASWYDFATEIFMQSGLDIKVNPIPAEAYPTPARRPHFSVMDKSKIKNAFGVEIPHWKKSLIQMLKVLRGA